ncbi:MAG TPA: polyphosphate kinase 2 family protein [Spirochaetota bacterium]|jgi:PPK2 family polyphosphate:nucleotide phosphotransferase|nr:MAG: Polyphosphate kinase 2 (PPK2) [Spirochaetes bacterium ADurb.Bin133]HNZ26620.1 polyphosphate kinase 2 family protein [Spirochaetota bacterium]HPY87249.1 polyphosphate kinase 2 family protein [Spirochaetota bacterium]HQB61256.1 polyphosphate kinase 2 family protein [Spirochaetota bacterium]
MNERFKVDENEKIDLNKIDPDYDGKLSKDELEDLLKDNIKEIIKYQEKLYAENKQSLLIVLQALDTGGKDGTIRNVFGPINPQGCLVTSFKAPTSVELAHDILWRVHKNTPAKGMIGIFNRSHYEDVLVVKVRDWIDDEECEKRYKHINNFEKLLRDNNTRILKFFLYISKDEQKKRLEERLSVPEKNWKFAKGDLAERKLWDKYMRQFEEVLQKTSTDYAPWYIIPANNKKYRNYLISSIVLEEFKNMDPKYPEPEEGLDEIVID